MATRRVFRGVSGLSIYAIITNSSNQFWNGTAFEAFNAANWTSYDVALTEISGTPGMYSYSVPALPRGTYFDWLFISEGGTPSIEDQAFSDPGSFDFDGTDINTITIAEDTYWADIRFTRNATNTRDEYGVIFYRNGLARNASLVTSPTIAVEYLDGTSKIGATSLTTPSSSKPNHYYYASGAERLDLGRLAIVNITATIDGKAVAFSLQVGRDQN